MGIHLLGPDLFTRYRAPVSEPIALTVSPSLASWDHKEHASQHRLRRALDAFDECLRSVPKVDDPVALHLRVAVDDERQLLRHNDLDNYLTPLLTRLRAWEVVSVRGTKTLGGISSVQIEAAVQDALLTGGWHFAAARATGSASSQAWKESIQDQIAEQALTASPGALELELSFRVGSRRNWVGLWKQSIDALGPILGLENPAKRFHPADGRIVHLGLHRTLAPELGGDVELGVWWRPGSSATVSEAHTIHPFSRMEAAKMATTELPMSLSPDTANLKVFLNDDAGYLRWLQLNPRGFVVNTYAKPSPKYLILHLATCNAIGQLQKKDMTWTNSGYAKVCATERHYLTVWARSQLGGRLKACGLCHP